MSGECPENAGSVRAQLAKFGRIQPIFFNDLGGKHLAHKAEVTGSNPVGYANYFNGLDDFCAFQKLPVPENFRRICSRVVPGKIGKCSNANRRTSPHGTSVTNNGECNGTRSKKYIL